MSALDSIECSDGASAASSSSHSNRVMRSSGNDAAVILSLERSRLHEHNASGSSGEALS